MSDIDYTELYRQAELETIAQKTEDILADPDGYECSACCIESQPCDVGLAVKVERERIIKLLEPLATCDPELCGENSEDHYREDCSAFEYQYAIDLIKGEQK